MPAQATEEGTGLLASCRMQSVAQQAPESDGETPCPPAPSLELLVRNSAGGPSWPVVLPADATSCALHEAVEKASGHAVAQQRLIFQGRILPVDATPLRSLGVESGLVVHLALRPAVVAGAPPAAASAAGSAVELAALSRDGRARAALVEDGLTEGELAMLMRLQLDEADAALRAADPGDVSDFCLGLLAGEEGDAYCPPSLPCVHLLI